MHKISKTKYIYNVRDGMCYFNWFHYEILTLTVV